MTAFCSHTFPTCSPQGVVLYVSPSIERVVQYRAKELMGKQFCEFVHPSDATAIGTAFAKATSSIALRYRRRVKGTSATVSTYGAAAEESPAAATNDSTEWLDVKLHGHVLEAYGVPESILLWETSLGRTATEGVSGSLTVALHSQSEDAKNNARAMTHAVHQLRNSLHALDASTQLIKDATGDSSMSPPIVAALMPENLLDLMQVMEQVWCARFPPNPCYMHLQLAGN